MTSNQRFTGNFQFWSCKSRKQKQFAQVSDPIKQGSFSQRATTALWLPSKGQLKECGRWALSLTRAIKDPAALHWKMKNRGLGETTISGLLWSFSVSWWSEEMLGLCPSWGVMACLPQPCQHWLEKTARTPSDYQPSRNHTCLSYSLK